MRVLCAFWDVLKPGALQERVMVEWQAAVGEDSATITPFLRLTGELAETYPCPAPGHDGCPRRVVLHSPEERIAVCGANPPQCDSLELAKSDLAVYRFDLALFAAAARKALGLRLPRGQHQAREDLVYLGHLPHQATPSIAVYLLRTHELSWSSAPLPGSILLTVEDANTTSSLDQWRTMYVGDVLGVTAEGMLCGLDAGWSTAAVTTQKPSSEHVAGTVLQIPPGTRWQDVGIRFVDGHTVEVTVLPEDKKRMNFAELGMKDRRSGNPNSQWKLLKELAKGEGELTWDSPSAHHHQRKRCQRLRSVLRKLFGIPKDPLPYDERAKGWRVAFCLIPEA